MMINAEIIAQNLTKSMDVQLMGVPSKSLKLKRVKFYEPDKELEAGFVYVSSFSVSDELPLLPEDSVLVCVDGSFKNTAHTIANSTLRASKGALLLVDGPSSYLTVFNAIQDVFERYTEWDEGLRDTLNGSGSIRDMIDMSVPIFENPMAVIDQDLRVMVAVEILSPACEGQDLRYVVRTDLGFPTTERAGVVKKIHLQNYTKRKPFFFTGKTTHCYCMNLYVNNCYSGMLSLQNESRSFNGADLVLFEYFAGLLMMAYGKFTDIVGCKIVDLRNVFHALMNGEPVSKAKISRALSTASRPDQFICVNLRQATISSGLPTEYICAQLESLLPGSIAIPYESAIAGILSLSNCPYGVDEALSILDGFLAELDFLAGVSNVFTDLQNVRSYFVQACCAIETASEIGLEIGASDTSKRHFRFKDYALPYIIAQSQKELAPQFLIPPGLLRLRAHDNHGSAEYWETLRVYLDNSMNASLTAKKLYLHRSTLHQRLKRIEKLLELDLKDPQDRLYLLFGIGVIEINERSTPKDA
jgi:hypothetical protein